MKNSDNNFLEAQRLILKTPMLDDLENLITLRTNPEVMRYIGNGNIQNIERIKEVLKININYFKKYQMGFFSVFEKTNNNFIGQAGLFHLGFDESQADVELAYRLLPEYWNKGYATELAKALVDYGFSNLNLNKIVAATHLNNKASQKVLENSGFVAIGEVAWYENMSVLGFEAYKSDQVELVAYNKNWPELAMQEIDQIKKILIQKNTDEFKVGFNFEVEHVGSTAVPGLSAKPVIDIQIAVDANWEMIIPTMVEELKKLEYVFWEDNPDKSRLFFVKGMPPYGEKRTHHVHVFQENSAHWKDRVKFRDYLIANKKTADEYGRLKQDFSVKYLFDREAYTKAKAGFVKAVLKRVVI